MSPVHPQPSLLIGGKRHLEPKALLEPKRPSPREVLLEKEMSPSDKKAGFSAPTYSKYLHPAQATLPLSGGNPKHLWVKIQAEVFL